VTRYVLTPGMDRPDMIHAEPIDPERCPVDDPMVISEDIEEGIALGMLEAKTAIACRRCGVADRSEDGDIPLLIPEHDEEGVG
jgi:hypothetical protein